MTNAMYDFDEVIDRREVPALKSHEIVLGADGMELFPAGVADMDFRVAPAIQKALEKRLRHGVFGYETVPAGLYPALAAWFENRHKWPIEREHILRAPNVLCSLAIAASLFSDEGDGIIVQPPVFFDFYDIISENHRRLVANPLVLNNGRYEMDFDGLERCAASPGTRLLFLCNPHNPVGRVWTRAELKRVADICRRNDVLVVSDEIHADITFPGYSYTPFATLSATDAKNSVICISPAKSFNIAACCASFAIIPDPENRKAFQTESSRLTVNKNNAFANVAMEAAYRDGGDWLEEAITYIHGNLELVRQMASDVPGVELIEPEGTFLVWLDFRGLGLSADALTTFLRVRSKWAVTRGPAFGAEGEGFARLNIACRRSALAHALANLGKAIERIN